MKKITARTQDVERAAFFGIDVPFMRHIGLLAERLEPGLARTRLPLQEELLNSRGDVHGGTLMSALDFTLSAAARSHDPLATGVITVEMSTHFLGAARTDLVFEASTIRRGSRIVFCEGEARDEHGNAVCVARATFKLVHMSTRAQAGLSAGAPQAELPLP
ncbi:PaaI family thioesterase [Noviherbaspirillum sp.]|uniref:PaaI family thioesterase n=1 Tax=Noviherbaspirillum sp. TaxID=1926288 RepID=UPI002FE3BB7D